MLGKAIAIANEKYEYRVAKWNAGAHRRKLAMLSVVATVWTVCKIAAVCMALIVIAPIAVVMRWVRND